MLWKAMDSADLQCGFGCPLISWIGPCQVHLASTADSLSHHNNSVNVQALMCVTNLFLKRSKITGE